MTEIHQALYRFWSSFGLPAYLSGHVPDDAVFPYITFDVTAADSLERATLTAFDWHQAVSGLNVNAERAQILDKIAEAIPYGGCCIRLDSGGILWLTRNVSFQTYYDDPDDASVIGGRTAYIVQYLC